MPAWDCGTACAHRPLLPDVVVQVPSLAVRHDEAEVSIVLEELLVRDDVGMPQEGQHVGLSQRSVSFTFAGIVEWDSLKHVEFVVLIVASLCRR